MIMDMNLIVLSGMGKSRFCPAIVTPLHAERGCISSTLGDSKKFIQNGIFESRFIHFFPVRASHRMGLKSEYILQFFKFFYILFMHGCNGH